VASTIISNGAKSKMNAASLQSFGESKHETNLVAVSKEADI
jgi:hypothetical protein